MPKSEERKKKHMTDPQTKTQYPRDMIGYGEKTPNPKWADGAQIAGTVRH